MSVDPALLAELARQLQGPPGQDGLTGANGAVGPPGPPGPAGGGSWPLNTMIPFSTIPGADADAKLDKFIADYGSADFKPRLAVDQRALVDIRKQHLLPGNGFTMGDPDAIATQADSHKSNAAIVRLRNQTGGGVFRLPDSTTSSDLPWNVKFQGIAFDAVPGEPNRLIETNTKAKPWKLFVINCSYANGAGLIGTSAVAQPVDAFGILGSFCDFNNITDTLFNVGGADCKITADFWLLNSPLSLKTDGPLAIFSSLSKTPVQNFYTTVQGAQIGFLVKQGGKGGLTFGPGAVLEGRLSANACFGSLAHLYGNTAWLDVNLNYAMKSPAAGWGGETKNRGFVHAFGGAHLVSTIYARYPVGVSHDVPLWYQETGALRISNVIGVRDSDNAFFKPVVKVGPQVDVVADGSVRLLPI